MGIRIEMDEDAFYKAMVREMEDTVTSFEEDLVSDSPRVFFFDDDAKDKAMIRAHIDALKLLIEWYRVP